MTQLKTVPFEINGEIVQLGEHVTTEDILAIASACGLSMRIVTHIPINAGMRRTSHPTDGGQG